jgi:DNA-binding MarR family transcriptional regulator
MARPEKKVPQDVPRIIVKRAVLQSLLDVRDLREQMLGKGLFFDPCWSLLLELYAAYLDSRKVSMSQACSLGGLPATTGFRYVRQLEERILLRRQIDPEDSRRHWLFLTEEGHEKIDLLVEVVVTALRRIECERTWSVDPIESGTITAALRKRANARDNKRSARA